MRIRVCLAISWAGSVPGRVGIGEQHSQMTRRELAQLKPPQELPNAGRVTADRSYGMRKLVHLGDGPLLHCPNVAAGRMHAPPLFLRSSSGFANELRPVVRSCSLLDRRCPELVGTIRAAGRDPRRDD
jgi:hypothetical protein